MSDALPETLRGGGIEPHTPHGSGVAPVLIVSGFAFELLMQVKRTAPGRARRFLRDE
jgi:hypothetical protein